MALKVGDLAPGFTLPNASVSDDAEVLPDFAAIKAGLESLS